MMHNPTKGVPFSLTLWNPEIPAQEVGRIFMEGSEERPALLAAINAALNAGHNALHRPVSLSSTGSFPAEQAAPSTVYVTGSNEAADLSWRRIFDAYDFRSTSEEGWRILDIFDAVTFRAYAAGERVELFGVSGTEAEFKFQLVGGGFQWLNTWLMDSKYYRVAQGLQAMAAGHFQRMAQTAYSVAFASGMTAQTRRTDGANVFENDVSTINDAATAILAGLYETDKLQPVNPSFLLCYNANTAGYPERVSRILSANYGQPNANATRQLAYPFEPLSSPHIPTGVFYVVMPGRRFQMGDRMALTTQEVQDWKTFSGANVGWSRYGFARGNTRQVRSIPLS